jgi:hypothetical protein
MIIPAVDSRDKKVKENKKTQENYKNDKNYSHGFYFTLARGMWQELRNTEHGTRDTRHGTRDTGPEIRHGVCPTFL